MSCCWVICFLKQFSTSFCCASVSGGRLSRRRVAAAPVEGAAGCWGCNCVETAGGDSMSAAAADGEHFACPLMTTQNTRLAVWVCEKHGSCVLYGAVIAGSCMVSAGVAPAAAAGEGFASVVAGIEAAAAGRQNWSVPETVHWTIHQRSTTSSPSHREHCCWS